MTKYLDENGLLYLWGKLKATFLHNASEGRFTGVSTNTSTGLSTFNVPTIAEHIYYDSNKNSTLKDKIDTIVTQGGEPNTIETVKVNGTALVPDTDKAVNITFTDSDTKNTAGSTNSNSKLYLVGATSQEANPQTYSRAAVYVGTDGKLRSGFGVNSATDADSIVVTNKDITYDMSDSGSDVIAVIDKTTGKVKPSSEGFDSLLQGFIDQANGINANDEGWWFNYAVCNTESNEAAKTANLISGSISYVLDDNNLPTYKEGTQVVVKFTNKNTESDPTLSINNVGSKEIHINGWPISGEWNAGALNNFVLLEYDGSYWNIVGPTTTDSIVWSGGGSVFDQNNSLSGCLSQLNGDIQILTGRAIKTVGYDTTTHTITTTKVPTGSTAQNIVTAAQIVADGLTFDSTPTADSNNPVTSAGIKAYVDNATPTITMDNTPTSGSSNPVKSSGIYNALQGKQNTLTFDSTPTASSTNPVTSGGVKTALDLKANQSTTYTKTEVDALFDDVAYLGDDDGTATTLDFDPQADTVWNIPQTLGSAQQAQARNNIGAVGSVTVNGTTYTPTNGNVDLGTIGGGGSSVTVDSQLSTSSTNPVQNSVITTALNGKVGSSTITSIVSLTEAAYTALATKDASTFYIIVES